MSTSKPIIVFVINFKNIVSKCIFKTFLIGYIAEKIEIRLQDSTYMTTSTPKKEQSLLTKDMLHFQIPEK